MTFDKKKKEAQVKRKGRKGKTNGKTYRINKRREVNCARWLDLFDDKNSSLLIVNNWFRVERQIRLEITLS
jgi:hypothetical protein